MAEAHGQSSGKRNLQLGPPGTMGESELIAFVDENIYYDTLLRAEEVRTYRLADLYDQGIQWLRHAYLSGDRFSTQFFPMQKGEEGLQLPLPVYNEGWPIMVGESARLGRAIYEPSVRITQAQPTWEVRAGARKAERLLKHLLDEQAFDIERDIGYHQLPRYGGWFLGSYIDRSWDDTRRVPVSGAMACAKKGGSVLSAAGAPCDYATTQPQPGQRYCPACATRGEQSPLVPYQPTLREAFEGQDSDGRPLGEDKPRDRWRLKTLSPYDVHLANQGVDIDYREPPWWVWCHVEHLDYVAMRWPRAERPDLGSAEDVRPESPYYLQHYHPVAGGAFLRGGGTDQKLFRHHARVKEFCKLPWVEYRPDSANPGKGTYQLNHGRRVVVANKIVLHDGPLLEPSLTQEGAFVEQFLLQYIPFEFRDSGRSVRGIGFWEQMKDAQDRVNETASQTAATNSRTALAPLLTRRGHNVEQAGIDSGIPVAHWEFDTDDGAPDSEPNFMDSRTIGPGIYDERESSRTFMERVANRSEVERGGSPPNVGAAAAIRMLKESLAETRQPRLERIAKALERGYGHGLRIVAHRWQMPERFGYKDEHGNEEWETLRGLDLQGQTDVVIDITPERDPALEQAEITDLANLQILDLTNPHLRRKIAERWSPRAKELFEDELLQESRAQREFSMWLRGRTPVVNMSLDDHAAHFQQHGRDALGEQMLGIFEKAGWDQALNVLNPGWSELLAQIKAQLQQQQLQAAMGGLQMNPMTNQPVLLPDPQTLITKLFTNRLGMAIRLGMTQVKQTPELGQCVVWFAHLEAHKMIGEIQMEAQAMMGQARMEAPAEPVAESGAPA